MSAHNPNRFRPALEACEDRTVPTTFVGVDSYESDAAEGGWWGTFVLSRWGDTSVTLSYTVGGTATPGSDPSLGASGEVQFAANEDAIFLQFTATDDTETESAETIILTLDPSTDYTIVDAVVSADFPTVRRREVSEVGRVDGVGNRLHRAVAHQEQADEDGDDGDDHQRLDQREPAPRTEVG